MKNQMHVKPLRWFHRLFSIMVTLLLTLEPTGLVTQVQEVNAQTSVVNIKARDAVTGELISNFKWQINLDNTHDHASLTPPASYSPVVAVGDQDNATGIELPDTFPPDRGYLVTVLANDGVGTLNDPDYKIGGRHFRLPQDAGDINVFLQPNPLPLATIKVRVFHDNLLVNSEDDIPLEKGLAGFHVVLSDRIGEVTTDWFGNPICTEYIDEPGGTPKPGTGGFCVTDSDGYATIPNLGPNKYEVEVIPPDGQGWIQTTTIEGTLHIDAWVEEGADGLSTEEGFTQALVWFGFVRQCRFGMPDLPDPEGPSMPGKDDCTSVTANSTGSGKIKGRIRSIALDTEGQQLAMGEVVVSPYIALNNIGGNDEQVWTGRGNPDGTFLIENVPDGLYQLVVWDAPLDHIISFRTVRISGGETVDMGDIGIPRWFGKIRGYVYIDANENGIRDPGEVGFPNQDLDTRFKDGTIQYTAFSGNDGSYEFPEVFELEHFTIAEVGYGRFKNTGAASYQTDEFGNPLGGYPHNFVNQDLGLAGLLQAAITWAGTTNYIDWGKKAFAPGENGGIVGIVFYATTRNELEARLQANEDYEPGVPGVMVKLYAPVLDADGNPVYDPITGEVMKDHLANTYITDSWYDALPKDCVPIGTLGRDPEEVEPNGNPPGEPSLFGDCVELPALMSQLRPGVFDGGYAFEEDCSADLANPDDDDDDDGIPNRFDPDMLSESCEPVAAGDWVVEIEPPPGYRAVMEEDVNVFSGDVFEPAIPPPPCAGPLHTVHVTDDPADAQFDINNPTTTRGVYNPDFLATPSALAPNGGSPFEGEEMPLCNARLVTLQPGQNANSDFFIFTEVPSPGRIRGLLLDDLTLELDPNSPMYGEKRGIPNAPVGIRDFSGRLITTVYSDENGYWEVLLPSTGTYNCPVPAGPCPGMYQVIGNDPGSPQHPNPGWNPNYGALRLVFDVWPGLTTYADVAILPITGFVQDPASQFETPPVCEIPELTPDLQAVSQPYGSPGVDITITGSGFGSVQGSGQVTLDGSPIPIISWSDTSITVELPDNPGPHQLIVTNGMGKSSPVGITMHIIGGSYMPNMIHVPGDKSTIQEALDDAEEGDLILVHPGVYFESVIMDKEIKLQGYGPGASVIDGRFFNFGGITADEFADKVAATAYDGPTEVPMGQVITVLAEKEEFDGNFNAQIDGFKISGGTRVRGNRVAASQGGAVYAHAYARNLVVSNNLIQSNSGNLGGGVILGRAFVGNPDAGSARDNENDNVRLHHNRILNNGGISLAGAVGLFNGAQNYEIDHNVICGNYSAEYGGGISHYGFGSGSIHDNQILFNYAFDEGGGVMIAGEQPKGDPQGLSVGTGAVTVERNLVQGNVSNDDGGGLRLLQPVGGQIRIVNNMVVNNLATDSGGGIALDDALNVVIVNNTVARNVSTATAEDADRTSCGSLFGGSVPDFASCPHGAGLVSEMHSQALLRAAILAPPNRKPAYCSGTANCSSRFSDPILFNNIFWQNEAFYLNGEIGVFGDGLLSAGYRDLEVLFGRPQDHYQAQYSICTSFSNNCSNDGTNLTDNPQFLQQIDLNFAALGFTGDPSFVTVIIKSTPGDPQGDYHVTPSSPAVDRGATTGQKGVNAPSDDYDGDGRPNGAGWDIGADEQPGVTPPPPPPPPSPRLFFSTAENTALPGLSDPDDADIYSWNGGTSFSRVFDASAAGLSGNADIDALLVVDSDTFYLSFTNDNVNIPTLGSVGNEDIVLYDGGAWIIFFDGSDVGLSAGGENVDAFEISDQGVILVSTSGNANVPGGVSAGREDLLRCSGSFGPVTTCTWSLYFDGSDVALSAGSENVNGAALLDGNLYLSTTGAFSISGLSGGGEDVFTCNSPTFDPPTTSCSSFSLFFDGSVWGVTDVLDAIDLPGGATTAVSGAISSNGQIILLPVPANNP